MDVEPICLLLVGSDGALLEGLSQSLGALGYATMATQELGDARDLAALRAPLIAVVEASLAATSCADALGIPLAAGGALVLWALLVSSFGIRRETFPSSEAQTRAVLGISALLIACAMATAVITA